MKKYEASRLVPLTESELELVSGGMGNMNSAGRAAVAHVEKDICEGLTGGMGAEFCGGSTSIAGKIHEYSSNYHATSSKSNDYSRGCTSAARHHSHNSQKQHPHHEGRR